MPVALQVSVILPTHNPHPARLRRTLAGLAAQTLNPTQWETLLIDNASDRPWEPPAELAVALPGFQRLPEPRIGLTPARLCGVRAARGEVLVFVDDDNVLAPDYLATALRLFSARSGLAAAGGPVIPEWETPPLEWTREFHGLLALRDLGPAEKICVGSAAAPWPNFAPVGAGLTIRRRHALSYADTVTRDPRRLTLDRSGANLASGGDNDLVFTTLHGGGDIAYFPELRLTHLIPASRLEPAYLARLNRGIMRTWVRVLHLHGQCPWPAIARWTVSLRYARAVWRHRRRPLPARSVTLAGLRGQFEGQAEIANAG